MCRLTESGGGGGEVFHCGDDLQDTVNLVTGAGISVTTQEVVAAADARDVENGTAGNHVEGFVHPAGKSGSAHCILQKYRRIII